MSQEQEPAPHIALDILPVSKQTEPHRRGPGDAAYEASEAGGDAGLALELEVLRSEEIAAGGAAGGDEDQVPASRVPARVCLWMTAIATWSATIICDTS